MSAHTTLQNIIPGCSEERAIHKAISSQMGFRNKRLKANKTSKEEKGTYFCKVEASKETKGANEMREVMFIPF